MGHVVGSYLAESVATTIHARQTIYLAGRADRLMADPR